MQENDKYMVLGTKVSPEAWGRLHALAHKKHLTIYELVQLVCDTLLRYMDDRHNLSEDMERIMAVFEHMDGWSEAFNLADPSVKREVGEATYFLQDADGKKRGVRCVHVTKPYFGERTETCNLQDIIDRTLMLITPERYARLQHLKEEMNCGSLLELIDILIDLHAEDGDVRELRQQFEDCNRSDYGKKIEYGQRTRQTKRRDIETMEQSLDFSSHTDTDTTDAPTADDMYEQMGFHPFGGEW